MLIAIPVLFGVSWGIAMLMGLDLESGDSEAWATFLQIFAAVSGGGLAMRFAVGGRSRDI